MEKVLLVSGAMASGCVLAYLVVSALTGRRRRVRRADDPRQAMFPRASDTVPPRAQEREPEVPQEQPQGGKTLR